VLLAGVALIVLPGPAVLVIPLGLAILATEFTWARKLLDRTKARLTQVSLALMRRTPADTASSRRMRKCRPSASAEPT
jgi:Putative transmembrane protein (PGPGW)